MTFSRGHLCVVTADLSAGILTLSNAPKYSRVEISFGLVYLSGAVIQRQCFGPHTRLIHIVSNPDTGVEGGDWLWHKVDH